MADPDPIEENMVQGLEAERRKLEALADRLSPPETAPEAAANWADSDEGKNAGAILAEMIGVSLRTLLFGLLRSGASSGVNWTLTAIIPRSSETVTSPRNRWCRFPAGSRWWTDE